MDPPCLPVSIWQWIGSLSLSLLLQVPRSTLACIIHLFFRSWVGGRRTVSSSQPLFCVRAMHCHIVAQRWLLGPEWEKNTQAPLCCIRVRLAVSNITRYFKSCFLGLRLTFQRNESCNGQHQISVFMRMQPVLYPPHRGHFHPPWQ